MNKVHYLLNLMTSHWTLFWPWSNQDHRNVMEKDLSLCHVGTSTRAKVQIKWDY